VPYGSYTYTISNACSVDVTGSVEVDCANDQGVAVYADAPAAKTMNDVFFFIGMMGADAGTVVTLSDGAGYTDSYTVQGIPMEDVMISNVPYGSYTYTISNACSVDVTGSVEVDCANDQGVAVYADAPAAKTTNDVFFFIGMMGADAGTVVTLSDGAGYTDSYTVQGIPMEDVMISDVPYGSYTYTISNACSVDVTGSVEVDCANDQGVAVYADAPAPIVIDNTVTQDGATITANQAGMTYQWIDCNDSNTPIDGETNQSFTATNSGNYAVVITNGSCGSATSDCISVVVTAMSTIQNNGVEIYPNPASDYINVELGQADEAVVSIFNSNGGLVSQQNTTGALTRIDLDALSNGVYFIRVSGDGVNETVKIIKK
jgi:hypothetical protein